MAKRLEGESSPYLLQHVNNPVDWYPWGKEAFAAAQAEDKPIFVSIGYAACHWCHVMAHESFEDEETAAIMNDLFINVKIDREERPDVDAVYMAAVHVTGESGGWPLSAFCDPKGRPFFLGTYFPPSDRYGRPSFKNVLRTMHRIYTEKRDQVEQNAEAVLAGLRQIDAHHHEAAKNKGTLDASLLIRSGRAMVQAADPHHGGFGTRPKFPNSSAHALLGRAGALSFGEPAREAFLKQCHGMYTGGIYDHLGGGFARYAVDDHWTVPHFEKMLYDNGQLLAIYADAYALTEREEYRELALDTVGWLEREMLCEAGGLYASLDADSEGEEGKFYVWTPEQVEEVLGDGAESFCRVYGVSRGGNFEHGTTVLRRERPRGDAGEEAALREQRAQLLAKRGERERPGTDDKVLAGWNGLAVTGLCRVAGAMESQEALDLALRVGTFLRDEMVAEQRVARVWKDGKTKLDGTLDDYAFCARAFLDLAEATLDPSWWALGTRLLHAARGRFYEERDGVGTFYMTPLDDTELLVHRPESHTDGAIPSGAAVMVECLVRLGRVAGDEDALRLAEAYLSARAPAAADHPLASSHLLCAVDTYLHGKEVVVSEGEGRLALLAAARRLPGHAIVGPWGAPSFFEGRGPKDGAAQAFVCHGQTCSAPIANASDFSL